MTTASFFFVGQLNDLLPREHRGVETTLTFSSHQSVKHLVESLGVPHVEVGSILVAGQPVEWGYRPQQGDRIEVHPATSCPCAPAFLLDNHLGRLAAYLRMLGFDCLYENTFSDDEMAAILSVDSRILLTRDRRLLMRKVVQSGYCLRSLEPSQQLREVADRFGLYAIAQPFHRCLRCNHVLEPVSKDLVLHRLEPKTKLYYNEFSRCPACDHIYWKGSHYEHMQRLAASITGLHRSTK